MNRSIYWSHVFSSAGMTERLCWFCIIKSPNLLTEFVGDCWHLFVFVFFVFSTEVIPNFISLLPVARAGEVQWTHRSLQTHLHCDAVAPNNQDGLRHNEPGRQPHETGELGQTGTFNPLVSPCWWLPLQWALSSLHRWKKTRQSESLHRTSPTLAALLKSVELLMSFIVLIFSSDTVNKCKLAGVMGEVKTSLLFCSRIWRTRSAPRWMKSTLGRPRTSWTAWGKRLLSVSSSAGRLCL